MESDPFVQFINSMLEDKQLAVEPELREQMAKDLQTRLMDQIDRAVIEALPEDKVDGLNDLLDTSASEQEVQSYIVDCGVDIQRVTLETMLRFRELYLGDADNNGVAPENT